MKQLIFHLETVTPMFLAGEKQAVFELRPPSFKGLLRFWWRAYYWGHKAAMLTPKDIEEEEGKMFGTTSNNGNKSRFSLRLKPAQLEGVRYPFPKHLLKSLGGKDFPINILEYLAYGTYEYQRGKGNHFIRDYLPPGTAFKLIVSLPDTDSFQQQEHDIVMSVYLLATCGGIGAKAHNGFGNLCLRSVTEKSAGEEPEHPYPLDFPRPFPTPEFFEQHVKTGELPDFTAFSKQMQIFELKQNCKSWDDCLAQLGEIYRECKGKLDKSLSCEKRQYIAAPTTIQQRVGGRWKVYDSSFLERHAKPYFLRVVRTDDGYQGYVIYFPSRYCPGLHRNRYNNPINQQQADDNFAAACKEFNGCLLEQMNPYYPG